MVMVMEVLEILVGRDELPGALHPACTGFHSSRTWG